ncbi:hypothetical protein [Arsukibacterium sp.]|uniref:hypothetical protein n=1 Tax=Arsukibacterium sp. TaxID=1977258 RepID=UPI00299E4F36|nr:hypothetical protein [Arsukibacterium sp.]MDX1539171.1 hypothetical protein [Arsukibacterium sp.]
MTLFAYARTLILEWANSHRRVSLFLTGMLAVLAYEAARAWYRPFIYAADIYDFHLADTLGNSLGTVATVLTFASLFGRTASQGQFVLRATAIGIAVYEMLHPLLGKPIDPLDLVATLLAGLVCDIAYRLRFNKTVPEKH